MNKEQYKKYLDSSAWKRLREQAMERANHKCELCGSRATQVHHISYPKNISDDKLDNLLVCCESCHQKQHGIRDGGAALLRRTIKKRIRMPEIFTNSGDYDGFDFAGYGREDEEQRNSNGRLSSRAFNWQIFSRFLDYMPNNFTFDKFKLISWKGMMWWADDREDGLFPSIENAEKEWNGEGTDDIIFWIIQNYGKYRKIENMEIFKREDKDGDTQ